MAEASGYSVEVGDDLKNFMGQVFDQVQTIRATMNNPYRHRELPFQILTLYLMVVNDSDDTFKDEWSRIHGVEYKRLIDLRAAEISCITAMLSRWKVTVKRLFDEEL